MQRLHNIRIKENSLLARIAALKLGVSQVAITLGNTIHLHRTAATEFLVDQRWVKHELAHVQQFRNHGFWRFIALYAWESLRHGYKENKYEKEAREKEEEPVL